MKIKKGFILTQVGDGYVAVQAGNDPDRLRGIVRLNGTGAFIWRCLEKGMTNEQIAEKMVKEYSGVDEALANRAVNDIVGRLEKDGLLEK